MRIQNGAQRHVPAKACHVSDLARTFHADIRKTDKPRTPVAPTGAYPEYSQMTTAATYEEGAFVT